MKKVMQILFLILLLVLSYAFFVEPKLFKINEYNIVDEKIPESFYGVKIIQFSDIHYGRTVKGKELKELVEKINEVKPDIVIFTGDLFDKDRPLDNEAINVLIDELSKIDAKLGKYAIYGNHEYYHDNYETVIANSGFTLLKNSYDIIYNESNEPIFLGGLDDLLMGDPDISSLMSYFDDESETVIPKYKIIAVHEPDYFDQIKDYDVDLVLAGHSHNGQVRIPLIGKVFTPEGSKKYYDNYYKVGDTEMYISSGIGCSMLNIRFATVPSFNLYRLKNK